MAPAAKAPPGAQEADSVWAEAATLAWSLATDPQNTLLVGVCCVLLEVPLNLAIIHWRPYTEIDWQAYMDEVGGAINGQYDYTRLSGDTGPLVYPAGFVYVFGALYRVTDQGRNIRLAQYLFAALYVSMVGLVVALYKKTRKAPPLFLCILCFTSYRVHSLFVLRLFNDPVAMTMLYGSVGLLLHDQWLLGCVAYSLAVSVKMNVLYFAPGLLLLLLARLGPKKTIGHLVVCAVPQVVLALPFLQANAWGYISRAFDFGRVFLYQWTVNWRLVPEYVFVDRRFHVLLLALHVGLLLMFAGRWARPVGGLVSLLQTDRQRGPLDPTYVAAVLFSCNVIGMACSRSLHYQFYVWYYHSIPLLAWLTHLPTWLRVLLPLGIELCWNTYPSTPWSSLLLHVCHGVLLAGLYFSPVFASPAPSKKAN